MDPILNIITYIPLAGALVILFFVNKTNARAIRVLATATVVIDFIASLCIGYRFDPNGTGDGLFQFRFTVDWIP